MGLISWWGLRHVVVGGLIWMVDYTEGVEIAGWRVLGVKTCLARDFFFQILIVNRRLKETFFFVMDLLIVRTTKRTLSLIPKQCGTKKDLKLRKK
jgi:hypothetical protein